MPGCKDCVVCAETGNVNAIPYLEAWESRDALYRPIRSRLSIRVLHAMDFALQPPEVSFYEISGQEGLDSIRTLKSREQEMQ